MKESYQVIYAIHILCVLFGGSSSLLLMWLIQKLKTDNPFNFLLYYMGFFNFLCFMTVCNTNVAMDYPDSDASMQFFLTTALLIWAGFLCSYMLSSYVSLMLVILVAYNYIFPFDDYKTILMTIATLPSLICVIVALFGLFASSVNMDLFWGGHDILTYFVWAPISVNVLCYFICQYKLKKMNLTTSSATTAVDQAIVNLMDRYKYYPILQVLGRICPTVWFYDFSHASRFDDMYSFDNPSLYSVIIVSMALLTFEVIAFLYLFLKMNPRAKKYLYGYLNEVVEGSSFLSSMSSSFKLQSVLTTKSPLTTSLADDSTTSSKLTKESSSLSESPRSTVFLRDSSYQTSTFEITNIDYSTIDDDDLVGFISKANKMNTKRSSDTSEDI